MTATGVTRTPAPLFELGFHGDRHLIRLVDWLAQQAQAFIETGANVGSTSRFMAQRFADMPVYSCECDPGAFALARRHLAPHKNACIEQAASPAFLYAIHDRHPELCEQTNLYWLDAHGYGFRWPLVDEIAFLTSQLERALVLIDDFRVPGRPEFKYDVYDGQVCALETIRPALHAGRRYTLVVPDHSEHTSPHHPLVGVGLIYFGLDLELPEPLRSHFASEVIET